MAQKRLIVIGLALAAVAAVAFVSWSLARPGPEPELKIVEPSDGELVEMSLTISGDSANISDKDEDHVMPVVYWPDGRRYYPVVERIDFDVDGDWSVRAFVGQEGDAGAAFDLIVVLNDAEARRELEPYVAEVRESGGVSFGLPQLPSGSQRLHTISVTRTR